MISKKQSSWQRLKENPDQMAKYKEWRRKYNLRKKQKEARPSSPISVADIRFSRKNVIYKITGLLLTVDLQDHEIVAAWKALKNMTGAVVSGRGAAA